MRRLVAIALLATPCVSAPQLRPESEEKANLASSQPPAGKAEACTSLAPCAKSDGMWMPGDLAAQTAGWGEGLVACKASLEKCAYVKPEPWVYVMVGIAGAVVGGFTVAGAYEFRDWLKR